MSYYNARWYDPQLGRFVSPDTIVPNPANPQDLNRYTYAGNNPVTRIDPSGHYDFKPGDDPWWKNRNASAKPTVSATKVTNTTAGTNWSLTSTYSDWYNFRGGPSGCRKCHTGVQNNKVALTNAELAAAQRKMQQAPYTGFEIVARSFEPVDYAFTAYHCLDGNGCDPDELAWTVMPLASGGLAARAKELHAQIPSAYQRSHSATAVMSVIDNADGELKYLVANNHGVTAEQRQILATNGIVVPYNKAMAPRHAELLALDYAEFFNMTPLEVAASWSVCPTCAMN